MPNSAEMMNTYNGVNAPVNTSSIMIAASVV